MKRSYKIFAIVLAIFLLPNIVNAKAKETKVLIDGKERLAQKESLDLYLNRTKLNISFPLEKNEKNILFLPINKVAYNIGLQITWDIDKEIYTVEINRGTKMKFRYIILIDEEYIIKNFILDGIVRSVELIHLDAKTFYKNGDIHVPLDFFEEEKFVNLNYSLNKGEIYLNTPEDIIDKITIYIKKTNNMSLKGKQRYLKEFLEIDYSDDGKFITITPKNILKDSINYMYSDYIKYIADEDSSFYDAYFSFKDNFEKKERRYDYTNLSLIVSYENMIKALEESYKGYSSSVYLLDSLFSQAIDYKIK